jgi:hypothetical protein
VVPEKRLTEVQWLTRLLVVASHFGAEFLDHFDGVGLVGPRRAGQDHDRRQRIQGPADEL